MRFVTVALLVVASTGCLYGRANPEVVPDQPPEYQPSYPPPSAVAPAPQASADPQAAPDDADADVVAPPEATQMADDAPADELAPPAPAGSDVASEDAFVEPLSPYGNWTEVNGYGRVWVPAVSYGWRPYYYGRWELTEWGWTFVSADPWGWAAYHYGRWNWALGVGWYWIPGRQWGPAWVNWRYGGGYVGWCPLGPRGVVFGYNHPAWVAVGEGHFTQPIARVAIRGRAVAGIIRAAPPLSGPGTVVHRGGAFGPPVSRIGSATGHRVNVVPVSRAIGAAHAQAVAPGAGAVRSPVRGGGVRTAPISRTPGATRPVSRPGVVTRPAPGGVPRPVSRPAPGAVSRPAPGVSRPAPVGRPAPGSPAGHPAAGTAHPSSVNHGGDQHK